MNLAEIRKEIDKDFLIVQRKAAYLEKELQHLLKHRHVEQEVRFHDYLSKYKNQWVIRLELQHKGWMASYITHFYSDKGLVAISPDKNSDYLSFYTAHFLKRFNERMKLELVMPADIIRAYADENLIASENKLGATEKGIYKFYCTTPHGYVLGTCNTFEKFYKLHTFLTCEMVTGSEAEKVKIINDTLEKYLKMGERPF